MKHRPQPRNKVAAGLCSFHAGRVCGACGPGNRRAVRRDENPGSNHRLANSEGSSGSFSSSSSNPGIGSEGARCAASIEAKAHLCVDALDPAAVHVCWFVLLSPQVASLGRVAGSDAARPRDRSQKNSPTAQIHTSQDIYSSGGTPDHASPSTAHSQPMIFIHVSLRRWATMVQI